MEFEVLTAVRGHIVVFYVVSWWYVSEEHIASIFKVEDEAVCSSEALVTTHPSH
jgi:hypothetical protein